MRKKYYVLPVTFVVLVGILYGVKVLLSGNQGNKSDNINVAIKESAFSDFIKEGSSSKTFPKSPPIYMDNGEFFNTVGEKIYITWKDVGILNKIDEPANRDNYPEDKFEVHNIPAQDYLEKVVATFEKWEDIENSNDKFLVVKYRPEEELKKFRVSFGSSDLFKNSTTYCWMRYEDRIERCVASFEELTFDWLVSTITKDRTLILVPVISPPDLAKKDELGNYMIRKVVLVAK